VRLLWDTLRKYPALLMLVIVYLISVGVVISNYLKERGGTGPQHTVVLRMAHWQLEPGIVKAVNEVIADYEAMKRREGVDVEVKQIPVPEVGYFQYVNTQLIGRTAPDMIECGMGDWALWQKFYARYFTPLNEYVDKPNPYNAGTAFENTSWRDTYFDQMRGGYNDNLQSYYRVPLSAFTVRLYYNVDLIREVWDPKVKGCDFPQTFADFMQMCKDLREAARKRGENEFVPIAGSQYNFDQFGNIYRTAMTSNYMDQLDTNLDGTVSELEYSSPLYSGALKLTDPPIRNYFQLMRDIADQSPPGATSMYRNQAAFLFAQQHAAMVPTGSWDFSTLVNKENRFTVSITDMPLPARDTELGKYVAGQPSEAATQGGFPFGITKNSPNARLALDFLQFASSAEENEKLNREMEWLPAVLDPVTDMPKPREELQPFTPRVEGYPGFMQFFGPGATQLDYQQQEPLYLSGDKSLEQFVTDYMTEYRHDLPMGVDQAYRDMEQTLKQQLAFAAIRRAALNGAVGASEAITGEPTTQLKSILVAWGSQRNARDHDMAVWVDNVAKYQQSQTGK
jgi:ABC-type glycerol-3-phosphate transport system substrate-binding protein